MDQAEPVRDQVSALLGAGRHTVAQAIPWQQYLLTDREIFDPVYQINSQVRDQVSDQLPQEVDMW
jgi:hypothetical protein